MSHAAQSCRTAQCVMPMRVLLSGMTCLRVRCQGSRPSALLIYIICIYSSSRFSPAQRGHCMGLAGRRRPARPDRSDEPSKRHLEKERGQ
eukprot:12184232-Heterocapsa_arctica.AAC.1